MRIHKSHAVCRAIGRRLVPRRFRDFSKGPERAGEIAAHEQPVGGVERFAQLAPPRRLLR